jgi:hypothetical protein
MPKQTKIVPNKDVTWNELNEYQDTFISALVNLSQDKKLLDVVSRELATPQHKQKSRVYTKSKNNHSDTFRDKLLTILPEDKFKFPKRNSIWAELVDIIDMFADQIVFSKKSIEPMTKALKIILDANKKASLNWKEQTARKIRYALTQTNSKDSVRESPLWPYMKDFEFREETDARSAAYRKYKDEIGNVVVPIGQITKAIDELYQKGLQERKIPDDWQKYMFCALQLSSGLRKPEILNDNTTKVRLDEDTTGVVNNWKIKADEKENKIFITGVAKKDERKDQVKIERPLIGLTTEQFLKGIDMIRPLVDHLTTKRKDGKTAKQQNLELEQDPQFLGLNKIWKDYFPEVIAHVNSYKDEGGVKRNVKNLGRQLYAGAAYFLFNTKNETHSRFLKKMFAHDSSESTMNYDLVRVVEGPNKDRKAVGEALPLGLKDCKACQDLLNEQQMQRQQLKTLQSENAYFQAVVRELMNKMKRTRQKTDKDPKQKEARKEQFRKAVEEIKKRGDKLTIDNVMNEMGWFSKDTVQVWVKELKGKLKSSQPRSVVVVPEPEDLVPINQVDFKESKKKEKKSKK